jgi:cytochrome oxidase Cu insertion factor (SCO1/SenC/PrrC family)
MKTGALAIAFGLTLGPLIPPPPHSRGSQSQADYDRQADEENKKHGWGEGKLKAGDAAPDFDLEALDPEQSAQLSSFAGKKPVVLVFGTYTCPAFRAQSNAIKGLAGMYKKQVEFLLISIREAHPTDGLQMEQNVEEGIFLPSPKSLEEKQAHALKCVRDLNIKFTTLVDTMDNKLEQAYTAWPIRLYLVGKDGRIAWKGKPGPDGFLPAELAVAIEEVIEH